MVIPSWAPILPACLEVRTQTPIPASTAPSPIRIASCCSTVGGRLACHRRIPTPAIRATAAAALTRGTFQGRACCPIAAAQVAPKRGSAAETREPVSWLAKFDERYLSGLEFALESSWGGGCFRLPARLSLRPLGDRPLEGRP